MMFRFIALLTLYCFTSTVFALPERTYDVQVLIFSHITSNTLQLQHWPAITPNNQAMPAAPAPQTAYDLQREKKILQKNTHYQILLDAAWPETWHNDTSTITIPFVSNNGQSQLTGTMTITLGHYFDVHTNFFFTTQTDMLRKIDVTDYFSRWDKSTFTFQFLQNRRMRSNELNYLDHPLIGMFIKIIPLK